jgi:hypothetical protein
MGMELLGDEELRIKAVLDKYAFRRRLSAATVGHLVSRGRVAV